VASRSFRVDDLIVYRKTKISVRPGQRARLVVPASNGDAYSYCVDKFWVVVSVAPDGLLVAKTRRGKLHRLNPDDPNLRRASVLESLFARSRFPSPTSPSEVAAS
jgi:hypothetical protein